MLIYIYVFALVVGGVLLAASILLGGEDLEADADVEADGDPSTSIVEVGGHGSLDFFVWSFRSIRFWIFFLAFFGLTGLVFQGFGLLPGLLALGVALVMGFATGTAATATLRWLASDTSATAASPSDYVGKTARVMLPVAREGVGKVRLRLRGSTVDVLATTDETEMFAAQEEAIIIGLDEAGRARIARIGDD